ncbi:MAG: flavodoxin family protein [Thermodesulfobacteriota bacterium]
MQAFIINASARGSRGVTQRLAQTLSQGLEDGGATVEQVLLKDLEITPCLACLSCMHKHPGRCVQRDGMDEIYPRLQRADLLVLGAPVYTDSMPSKLKAVIDRCICAMQPFWERGEDGRMRHPLAWPLPKHFLLLSVAGFPEPVTFEPLIATFRAQAYNFRSTPLAEFCIPGAIALQFEPTALEGHLALLRQAGREIAHEGRPNPVTAARINRPPLSQDRCRELNLRYEDWCRKQQAKASRKQGGGE